MATPETSTRHITYQEIEMIEYTTGIRDGGSLTDLKYTYATTASPIRYSTKEEAYQKYKTKFPDS